MNEDRPPVPPAPPSPVPGPVAARRPRPVEPPDAARRRAAPAVVCYDVAAVPVADAARLADWRASLEVVEEIVVPPRDARAFRVPADHGFRIVATDGPQVGDLNLWNAHDLDERFWSGKTRQLHASHVTTGDRLWSALPWLRPLATITDDSLAWYGTDADGARVHDVVGTRCDPYTNRLLAGVDYGRCCHSNLVRALSAATGLAPRAAERHVHDVLNVFMCTGFTRGEGRYFMKASPARPGDRLELRAEIDLLGALSSCPGGDCGSGHSDDVAPCFALRVEILRPSDAVLAVHRRPAANAYPGTHGIDAPA